MISLPFFCQKHAVSLETLLTRLVLNYTHFEHTLATLIGTPAFLPIRSIRQSAGQEKSHHITKASSNIKCIKRHNERKSSL